MNEFIIFFSRSVLTTLEAQEEPAVFLFLNRHSCRMSPLTASNELQKRVKGEKKFFSTNKNGLLLCCTKIALKRKNAPNSDITKPSIKNNSS